MLQLENRKGTIFEELRKSKRAAAKISCNSGQTEKL
jgi:hypothetical protein